MMAIRSYRGRSPMIPESAFVDRDAIIIGEVILGNDVSVWPGAVLRADDDSISIGSGSAVMDVSFIEAPEGRPVTVGERCLLSHGVRLHGCSVGNGALIGIGAILLDGAVIGEGAIVGAGSVVTPGAAIGPGELAVGAPAKAARTATEEEAARTVQELEAIKVKAEHYRQERAACYR